MSQARRDEEEEGFGQAQLVRERADLPRDAKLVGDVTHDQLCDAIHEEVINSEMIQRDTASLALQEKQISENNPGCRKG